MFASKIESSELEDRFDAKYYDPRFIEIVKKAKKNRLIEVKLLRKMSTRVKKGIFEIRASEYKKEGIPFIRVTNVKTLNLNTRGIARISAERSTKNSQTELRPGDIVITKGGTLAIGTVAPIPPWIKLCNVCQDIIAVSLAKKENNPWYVSAFLASRYGKIQFQRIKTQQNQPHLTLDPVKNLRIFVPKNANEIGGLVERAQKLAGSALNVMQEAIELVNQSIEIKIPQKESRMFGIKSADLQEMLTPKFYYPLYDITLKKMMAKFNTVKLDAEIASIERGVEVGSKQYRQYLEKRGDDVPFVRTSDIVNYTIDDFPDYFVARGLFDRYQQDLREGDILFANDGKIGPSAMIVKGDECIIQSHIRRVRLRKVFAPEFVFAFLNTKFGLYQVFRRMFVQATIATIGNGLSELEVPVIDSGAQSRVVALVKRAMKLEVERKALIKKAREAVENILSRHPAVNSPSRHPRT